MEKSETMLKAFRLLFNQRALALRGEALEKLCILALSEGAAPDNGLTRDEICTRLASILGTKPSEGLHTIVANALHALCKDERASEARNGRLMLSPNLVTKIRPLVEATGFDTQVSSEIIAASRTFAPTADDAIRPRFIELFKDTVDKIADSQVDFFIRTLRTRGEGLGAPQDVTVFVMDKLSELGLAECVDIGSFVKEVFVTPRPALRNYVVWWIQGKVLFELLSFNPDFESIRTQLVAGKTLYLDSNILFALFQGTHPFHHFVKHLLAASRDELGVRLVTHVISLDEIHNSVNYQDQQFTYQNSTLRDLVSKCAESGEDPADQVEEPLIADFLRACGGATDIPSWRRFIEPLNPLRLKAELKRLNIDLDTSNIRLPKDEYDRLSQIFYEASARRMRSGPGRRIKLNPGNDAQIYRHIMDKRVRHSDYIHLSHDRYLLTIDGSLTGASQMLEIPIEDTYYLFPNQWYELVFPFLHVNARNLVATEESFGSMLSGVVFPALKELIPLELYELIFRAGGGKLPLKEIQDIARRTEEERRLDILAGRHPMAREQEFLKVEREVIRARVEADEKVQEANRIVSELSRKHQQLLSDVMELEQKRNSPPPHNGSSTATDSEELRSRMGDGPHPELVSALNDVDNRTRKLEEQLQYYLVDHMRLMGAEKSAIHERLLAEKEEVLVILRAERRERERLSDRLVTLETENKSLTDRSESLSERVLAFRRRLIVSWILGGLILIFAIVTWALR